MTEKTIKADYCPHFRESRFTEHQSIRKEMIMNAAVADAIVDSGRAARYARCVKLSKAAEWHIDRDLLRGRSFDFSRKFLPDGLSLVDRLGFLSVDEARLLSQIQGR